MPAAPALLEPELSLALTRGEFVPFLQPFVHLASGDIVGGELLARWYHPSRGLVSPGVFLPALIDTGLITSLTDVMFEAAGELAKGNRMLSLNLAAADIEDPRLGERIDETFGIADQTKLCVEVIEIELGNTAMQAIENLNVRGVQIAVDDFGAAFSSLARVVELRVDIVKLDRSLVMELDAKPRTQVLLRSFVGAMHELGTLVLAEGIETPAELDQVRAIGCDLAQGYIFGKPAPLERVAAAFATPASLPAADWPN